MSPTDFRRPSWSPVRLPASGQDFFLASGAELASTDPTRERGKSLGEAST